MRSFVALSVVLFATSASASPVITIPVKRLQRSGAYLEGTPGADRAHAAFLKSRRAIEPTTVWATNHNWYCTARVGVGDPPTHYNLIISTDYSDVIIFDSDYKETPTSEFIQGVRGRGLLAFEYLDQVTLAPNLVIPKQAIYIAYGDIGVDGYLGIGRPDGRFDGKVPTVMDSLMSKGLIEKKVLGIYLVPQASTDYSDTSALTYGGADRSLYEGELTYVPVANISLSSDDWTFNITSATYGEHTIIPTSTFGTLNINDPMIYLPADIFEVYLNAIPGATFDNTTGLIDIPTDSVQSMQSLKLTIANGVFTMDVADQLLPKARNKVVGGDLEKQYSVVTKHDKESTSRSGFILGEPLFRGHYVVLDLDNNHIGFAEKDNTSTTHDG